MVSDAKTSSVIRIPPYHYIHVLDKNDNVTRILTGPKTFIRQEHEQLVQDVTAMVVLAAQEYCIVKNPVKKNETGQPIVDDFGQVRLRHGDFEYRFCQEPFPLYPGEKLHEPATPMRVVLTDHALLLRATMNFEDADGEARISGDLWLFEGPGTYKPRKEVSVVSEMAATEIKPNTALKVRATRNGNDRSGKPRVFGEEWLIKELGAYMPGPYEQIVDVIKAVNLDEKTAIQMRALRTHVDQFGRTRKHGSEWLITLKDTETLIPDVNATILASVPLITLNNRQYCVILDPVDQNSVPQFGRKKLVRGEASFFLQPGESLESGIQDVYVLSENEALVLCANEAVEGHQAGERWMLTGPCEFVPPVEVAVADRRQAIPLDENEGIYVRDTKTGKVRAVTGRTYILNQDEELWSKSLPAAVQQILSEQRDPLADRGAYLASMAPQQQQLRLQNRANVAPPPRVEGKMDLTRVITYQVPHNAAVQIYDYKEKKARVNFGPDLVMLGPDEQFTQLSISGGKPKRPNMIKALCLLLGPDFCTDVVTVETADHARLSLQLSYNWHFDLELAQADPAKLFSVPDFIGDACKAIASRVRGTVAAVQFDDFHKNSARIIRSSVFGMDEAGKVRDKFIFPQNCMIITSIDVQSVEPVDQRTRDSLQKSVQLAIEITTNSQEAAARHEAERLEQEARGRLERQKIEDEAQAEKSRSELLALQVESAALESTGQAKAEAQSRAEASRIEGRAAVESARFKAEAMEIDSEAELKRLKDARDAELAYLTAKNDLQVKLAERQMEIDVAKFSNMLKALGPENLCSMAKAGPDQDVRMLKALGLSSTVITDGSSPINLLQTAHGLIGQLMGGSAGAAAAAAKDANRGQVGHPADDADVDIDLS